MFYKVGYAINGAIKYMESRESWHWTCAGQVSIPVPKRGGCKALKGETTRHPLGASSGEVRSGEGRMKVGQGKNKCEMRWDWQSRVPPDLELFGELSLEKESFPKKSHGSFPGPTG